MHQYLCLAVGFFFVGLMLDCKEESLFVLNVEALSQSESGSYVHCWRTIVSDPTSRVKYCGTCDEIPGREYSGMDFCK